MSTYSTGTTTVNLSGGKQLVLTSVDLGNFNAGNFIFFVPSTTPTSSISITPSVSPSISITPSISLSSSITATPSATASTSLSPSASPTISNTPSITPSITSTPSITPTTSPSPEVFKLSEYAVGGIGAAGGFIVAFAIMGCVWCIKNKILTPSHSQTETIPTAPPYGENHFKVNDFHATKHVYTSDHDIT